MPFGSVAGRLRLKPGVRRTENEERMSRVSIRGVLIGGVTDIGATIVLALPLIVYVMAKLDVSHLPPDQVGAAFTAAVHGSAPLYALQLVVGLACSILGGYVAAWLAKHDELLNGLLSSFLCVILGVYSLIMGKSPGSSWVQLLLLAASPMFGMIGGYLRLSQMRAGARRLTTG